MKTLLNRRRFVLIILLYTLFALAALVIAPLIGSEPIDIKTVLNDLTGGSNSWTTDTRIFIYQRIPRVSLGFLAGGTLALVGSVFQVILRNPLAAPSTLGVTGGGSVGAILAISLPWLSLSWGPFSTVQLFALAGSALIILLIYMIARRSAGISMNTLLLAGVTLGILCGALSMLIKYLASPHMLVTMDRWLMGGLDIIGYQPLAALFPLLVPGLGLLFLQMNSLNHLSLGEEMALGHGVDVKSIQRISFLGGCLATSSVVSLVGPIYFVGLIIPHTVRALSGYDHRIVLPASFLTGAGFLVICDTAARTLLAPTEMPVGILTAILGGPFFIYLLLTRKNQL